MKKPILYWLSRDIRHSWIFYSFFSLGIAGYSYLNLTGFAIGAPLFVFLTSVAILSNMGAHILTEIALQSREFWEKNPFKRKWNTERDRKHTGSLWSSAIFIVAFAAVAQVFGAELVMVAFASVLFGDFLHDFVLIGRHFGFNSIFQLKPYELWLFKFAREFRS